MRLEALVPSRDSRARTRSPSLRAGRPDFPGAAREPLPDHAGESPLLSRSGGEKGLRGSGAGTLGVPLGPLSSLRLWAQVKGTHGFLPHPKKDLESSSSKRLEARLPYHDSRAMRRSPSPCPWRPDFRGTTGVSLSSPSYLVRNPNQALHLEKTHEMPPSSPDEGLLCLHGLESNPESSLQNPQEA